jgi:hypothetical protein
MVRVYMKNDQIFTMQLFEFLNSVKNRLPEDDIKNIIEFIENREWGLGYETLCTQIYEYNIQIHLEFYKKISFFGKLIGVKSSIWIPLKELIIDDNNEMTQRA